MATKPIAHGHRGDWFLMANARILASRSIDQVARMTNAHFASNLFATGSTSGHQICVDAGIDPDGYDVPHGSMPKAEPKPLTLPAGWLFLSADMSIIAAGGTSPGSVTMIRDKADRDAWNALPDGVNADLYAYGRGMTLDEALQDAFKNALATPPIPTTKD